MDIATPIEIKLGDGTVVKANDMEEAFRTVAKMKEDTAAALAEARAEAIRYKTESEATAGRLQELERAREVKQPIATGNGKMSAEQHQRWQQYYADGDPVGAANYVDSIRFGIPSPDAVPGAFIGMSNQVTDLTKMNVAATFMAENYDVYDQTPANNRILNQELDKLYSQGFPYNAQTAKFAFDECVRRGVMKEKEIETQRNEPEPNPTLGGPGSAGGLTQEEQKYESMTTAQLEALVRSKGMIR